MYKGIFQFLGLCLLLIGLTAFIMPNPEVTLQTGHNTVYLQSTEVVYDTTCGLIVTPEKDFKVHVPLKDNGDEDFSKVYSTGKVEFEIKNRKCGIYNIVRKDTK